MAMNQTEYEHMQSITHYLVKCEPAICTLQRLSEGISFLTPKYIRLLIIKRNLYFILAVSVHFF